MLRTDGGSRLGALAAALLLANACSGDPATPAASESRMSARIDGAAWASEALPGGDVVTLAIPGTYLIDGRRIAGGSASGLTLTLYNIRGPGTYPMGMGPTAVGGVAQYVEGSNGWATPLSGASGTVTVTALSAINISGTFAFTGEPVVGGATGTKNVTEGRFDFPVRTSGNLGALPDHAGNRIAATVGGSPWNASTISASAAVTGILAISASNTAQTLGITLSGFDGPGTYPLGNTAPSRTITVLGPAAAPQSGNCCWGTVQGSTGTVTITSRTATRVTGTFSATLLPLPGFGATAPLVVSNGTFDVGLQ
jgi:hypothetical protein